MRCDLNGHCQITIDNRHICTYCRLKKCLDCGMQIELIRCSRQGNSRKSKEKKPFTTNSVRRKNKRIEFFDLFQFEICNLIDRYPQLSQSQRDILDKLNHLYAEYQIFAHVKQFAQEQNSLPIKLRLKISSFDVLFRSIVHGIELFFKLNQSFLSSCEETLVNLHHYALEHAGHLTIAFIRNEIPFFSQSNRTESILFNLIHYLPHPILADRTFLHLSLIIFIFSITDYSHLDRISLKDILHIQNIYVEMTWKYLISKYPVNQSVMFVIHLIRSFFLLDQIIREIHQLEEHQRLIENLLGKLTFQRCR